MVAVSKSMNGSDCEQRPLRVRLARALDLRSNSFLTKLRRAKARLLGVELDARVKIDSGVRFEFGFHEGRRGRIAVGQASEIGLGCVLNCFGGEIEIGKNVFVGPYVVIFGHGGVTIGDHTLISMHVKILSSNHMIPPGDELIRSKADILLPARIGRDVWIGAGATILGGVSVGDGCVVGAGAVVSRDLPPGSIAIGIPAKVVRYRDGALQSEPRALHPEEYPAPSR
jgi:acetyltransferase-like isoleucine patch superfamily enzyme